jgi:hypothetical protein
MVCLCGLCVCTASHHGGKLDEETRLSNSTKKEVFRSSSRVFHWRSDSDAELTSVQGGRRMLRTAQTQKLCGQPQEEST